jgi:hypothetical protein
LTLKVAIFMGREERRRGVVRALAPITPAPILEGGATGRF